MYKILAKVESKVRVITDYETKRKKKERIGKIVAMTENFVVVKYARGHRESFNIADFVAPAGLRILMWDGEEWRDIEYENEIS